MCISLQDDSGSPSTSSVVQTSVLPSLSIPKFRCAPQEDFPRVLLRLDDGQVVNAVLPRENFSELNLKSQQQVYVQVYPSTARIPLPAKSEEGGANNAGGTATPHFRL